MSTSLIILAVAVLALLLIVACAHVYKTAEVHELHKMRAAFEKIEHKLEKESEKSTEERKAEIRGEIEGLKEAIKLLEEEEASL